MKETVRYEVWSRDSPILPGIRDLIRFGEARGRRLVLSGGISGISFRATPGNSVATSQLSEVEATLAKSALIEWKLMGSLPKHGEQDSSQSLTIHIDVEPHDVLVTVGCSDVDLLTATLRQIEQSFGFQQLPPGLKAIRQSPHATAMIGCHFDDMGKAAGLRVQQFLSLIGFARVDIADTFRADPIPDKIREFLDKNSFYIGIVTGNQDHSWITSESSYAIAKDKEVILILAPNAEFNPTLYGKDREHLRFKHSIEETFIGLLQEIRARGVIGF